MKLSKNIMVLSNSEGGGKSFFSTIICRYLTINNKKVSPFKLLNITKKVETINDIEVISKAQALQAEASDIKVTTKVNPALVDLSKDEKKLYIDGRFYRDVEYNLLKECTNEFEELFNDIFKDLESKYDYVVLEGEGACKNMQNKPWDFLNFDMAKKTNSDVLLVVDCSKEDAFPSLYGTLKLLDEDELRIIKGIFLNKYSESEESSNIFLNKFSGEFKIDIIGKIPEMNYDIEKQKVVNERFYFDKKTTLEIGIVNFPGISKKADFYPLEEEDNIKLNYINNKEELSDKDIIIIPGSRNTLSDLEYIKDKGILDEIIKEKNNGKFIFGIGSGFQMLGKTINDIYGLEGEKGEEVEGINLLPIDTIFTLNKKTVVTKGQIVNSIDLYSDLVGKRVYGYELINGEYKIGESAIPFIIDGYNNIIGIMDKEGYVVGTYLHGLFESDEFRKMFLEILKSRFNVISKNQTIENKFYSKYKKDKFDLLLKDFLLNVNIDKFNTILNLK